MPRTPLRWLAIGMIVFSSMINYLDRQLLAALAPTLKSEFHLNNAQYGQIVSAFSVVYGLVAPLAGALIDKVGLNTGITAAVMLWSFASAATGWTTTFPSLLACRSVLGVSEAAGIPASGKANATYLHPSELALGTGINQIGLSLGAIFAPLLVAAMAPRYGWRSTFVLCGVIGLAWVPLWRLTARHAPALRENYVKPAPYRDLLRDRRFWGLVLTTVFVMMLYTLWTNWTTVYFVQERHMSQDEANRRFAWIPPVFASLGGIAGGWIMYMWIRRGMDVLKARMRLCWISAAILLSTAAVPLAPTPGLAAAAISLSFFWSVALSGAVYALPIDLFGQGRAAFGVAALTCAYGWMQTFLSPAIGAVVDRTGFSAVCVALSLMPLVGVGILRFSLRSTTT
jgi:MFS transporter, ACS family, aldohexuronate transporter